MTPEKRAEKAWREIEQYMTDECGHRPEYLDDAERSNLGAHIAAAIRKAVAEKEAECDRLRGFLQELWDKATTIESSGGCVAVDAVTWRKCVVHPAHEQAPPKEEGKT